MIVALFARTGITFAVIETGGGCRALSAMLDGHEVLVTDGDCGLPVAGGEVLVGIYAGDCYEGDAIVSGGGTLNEALAVLDGWRYRSM